MSTHFAICPLCGRCQLSIPLFLVERSSNARLAASSPWSPSLPVSQSPGRTGVRGCPASCARGGGRARSLYATPPSPPPPPGFER